MKYHIKCSKNVQQITSADKIGLGRGHNSCADPESFVRGGPTLTTIFFPFFKKNGPSSTRQQNAIDMAFRWRADDGSPLNAGLVAL